MRPVMMFVSAAWVAACGANGGLDARASRPVDSAPAADQHAEQDAPGASAGSPSAPEAIEGDAGAGDVAAEVAPEAPTMIVLEGVVLAVYKDELQVEIADGSPIPPLYAIGVLSVEVRAKGRGGADVSWVDVAEVYAASVRGAARAKSPSGELQVVGRAAVNLGILERLAGNKRGGAPVLKKGLRVRYEQVPGKFHGLPL